MAKLNVKDALTLINEKIVEFLEKNCTFFYQKSFSLPDLRQELITYVLIRINILYISTDGEQVLSTKYNFLSELSKNTLSLENIISQGVYDLLPQNNNCIKQREETEIIASLRESLTTSRRASSQKDVR